jgi:nucleoside-diphosphate-sugar epimerase
MKIVLTGATGFVGSEVLSQMLAHPEVTQVTCLTRRPLSVAHRRLVAIVHEDFARYDDALVAQLADHAACIWTLGGKASDARSIEAYERVTHTFTLAFARAMAGRARGHFTFCYVSGMGADPAESSRSWWERTTRHLKGRTERDLRALEAGQGDLSVRCFRPGGILRRGSSAWIHRLLAPWVIGVEELAEGLVLAATTRDVPLDGTIENADIKALARVARGGVARDRLAARYRHARVAQGPPPEL